MKRIILFKEGFHNLVKANMPFRGTDEDMWVCVIDKAMLDNFIQVNNIVINKHGHIIAYGEVWGVIQ